MKGTHKDPDGLHLQPLQPSKGCGSAPEATRGVARRGASDKSVRATGEAAPTTITILFTSNDVGTCFTLSSEPASQMTVLAEKSNLFLFSMLKLCSEMRASNASIWMSLT